MDKKIKDDKYKIYINNLLNQMDITKESYLLQDVPEQILYDADIITDYNEHRLKRKLKKINDLIYIAVDIVRITKNNDIHFIKCDGVSDELVAGNFGNFWLFLCNYLDKEGHIYHSVNKVSKNIILQKPDRVKLFHEPFLTTSNIYELEENNFYDTKDIFEKNIHKMDFRTAIQNKYICDYNIYLPILEDEYKEELDDLISEIKKEVSNIDNIELCKKCCYLYECIKNFGTLKCIIYFQSHEEIKDFIKYFNKLNEYYAYKYNITDISCYDNKIIINEKINVFRTSKKISFLCSVDILDEYISIQECNSIYMTYNCKSKIKNVKRTCGAMNINKYNPNKIAKIILWCDNVSDTLIYMNSIKEVDPYFHEKIRFINISKKLNKSIISNEKYKKYMIKIIEHKGSSSNNLLDNIVYI